MGEQWSCGLVGISGAWGSQELCCSFGPRPRSSRHIAHGQVMENMVSLIPEDGSRFGVSCLCGAAMATMLRCLGACNSLLPAVG